MSDIWNMNWDKRKVKRSRRKQKRETFSTHESQEDMFGY